MIGGNSAGSGWSFFRSSSSSSQSSSRNQARLDPDSNAIPTASPDAHSSESPQSGDQQDARSSNTRNDLQSVELTAARRENASLQHDMPIERFLTLNEQSLTPEASTSATTLSPDSTLNVQAPPSTSRSGTPISAGTPSPVSLYDNNTLQPTQSPNPPYHLHSLTERKLEKAVLGRAVGLRQLVLLSNAFATRPAAPQPCPQEAYSSSHYSDEHSLRYPHASTSRSIFDDEELDAGVIDYEEDEAERKRREEDWLDSMLDEMLTDAEDDDDEDGKKEQESISLDRRIPSRSEREFKEPYVHLSIKHSWNTSTIQSSPSPHVAMSSALNLSIPPSHQSLLAQHAAMLDDQNTENDVEHLETASSPSFAIPEYWMGDSGFMEPYTVPLPESTDASPNSSANSEASDDGNEEGQTAQQLEKESRYDASCVECEASDNQCCEAVGQDNARYQESLPTYPEIGIPIQARNSGAIPSSHSFTSLSLPELAYSATSLNTLSSSPSHSINVLHTPGTSPPPVYLQQHHCREAIPSNAELEKQAWEHQRLYEANQVEYEREREREHGIREAQEVMLPMDDLDLYDDHCEHEAEDDRRSSSSQDEERSSNGSSTSSEDTTHTKRMKITRPPSLELVRYESATAPNKGRRNVDAKEQEDTALWIPLYFPLSTAGHSGLFSPMYTTPTMCNNLADSLVMPPPLPPSLLSVMMGKSPVVEVEVPSTLPLEDDYHSSSGRTQTISDRNDRLRLPMFIPTEIVKSLYDSVDFGLPPRFTTGSSLQPQTATSSSARSAPNSPQRSRSKSLTQVDPLYSIESHTSPGGLLFSSLGLFGSRDEITSSTGTRGRMWDECYATQRRRSLSSFTGTLNPPAPDTFTMNAATDVSMAPSSQNGRCTYSRARSILHSHNHRNESRSPSRLRLFVDQGDIFADDFEFGSI